MLTSQSLSPWCDCRRLGSTWASWRWQDINVGNPLWRRALLNKKGWNAHWRQYIRYVFRLTYDILVELHTWQKQERHMPPLTIIVSLFLFKIHPGADLLMTEDHKKQLEDHRPEFVQNMNPTEVINQLRGQRCRWDKSHYCVEELTRKRQRHVLAATAFIYDPLRPTGLQILAAPATQVYDVPNLVESSNPCRNWVLIKKKKKNREAWFNIVTQVSSDSGITAICLYYMLQSEP